MKNNNQSGPDPSGVECLVCNWPDTLAYEDHGPKDFHRSKN